MILIVIFALVLDLWLGEPKRWHPLVFFGRQANKLECKLNEGPWRKGKGAIALAILLVMPTVGACFLESLLFYVFRFTNYTLATWLYTLVAALVLYLTLGWRSLNQHAKAIQAALRKHRLQAARHAVAMIVSRDTQHLDEEAIAKAATESVLENGADAIFAAIFWFLMLGLPGAVLYRMVNTLDAMWGYKNERFYDFGWSAAKLDDLMNWLPARLTALSYALAGRGIEGKRQAFKCWMMQANQWKSSNAGAVMAAGAGALGVSLGGGATYNHQFESRTLLGVEPAVQDAELSGANLSVTDASTVSAMAANMIQEACSLVGRALMIWVLVLGCLEWMF